MAYGFFFLADCFIQRGERAAGEVLFLWVLSGAFGDALGGWAVFVGEFCRGLRILRANVPRKKPYFLGADGGLNFGGLNARRSVCWGLYICRGG